MSTIREEDRSPLWKWMERQSVTSEEMAELLAKAGCQTKAAYVDQVKYGFRRPGFDLAEAIETATKGRVKAIDQLRYRRPDGATEQAA